MKVLEVQKSTNEFGIDYTLILYNNNQSGTTASFNVTGTVSKLNSEEFFNVNSNRANQANGYKTGSQASRSDIITTAFAYADTNGRNRRTNLGGHQVNKNLSGTSVGNNNIQSVGLIHKTSN